MKITKKIELRINRIVEVLGYGIEWVRDIDPQENPGYRTGAIETLGHQAACMLCQWISKDSEPTSDTIVALHLHELPAPGLLRRYIRRHVRA